MSTHPNLQESQHGQAQESPAEEEESRPEAEEGHAQASRPRRRGRRGRRVVAPLDWSNALLKRLRALIGPQLLVGFSGGRDSLAVLHLAARHFDVHPYFYYLIPDSDFGRAIDAQARAVCGNPLRQFPHPLLTRLINGAVYKPHSSSTGIGELDQIDMWHAVQQATGIPWRALGMRASESMHRRMRMIRWGPVRPMQQTVYPIATWSRDHVSAYLGAHHLAVLEIRVRAAMTGWTLHPAVLAAIKDAYPRDYRRIVDLFPYAIARSQTRDNPKDRHDWWHDAGLGPGARSHDQDDE